MGGCSIYNGRGLGTEGHTSTVYFGNTSSSSSATMFIQSQQLIDMANFDPERLVFDKPTSVNIPNSPVSVKRIILGYRGDDGRVSEVLLPTEPVFSFGVSENRALGGGPDETTGLTLPLCLWSRPTPTEAERRWTDVYDLIVECSKDHVLAQKDALEKYDLERAELKKLNSMYWRRENGKVVTDAGPTLYAKLITAKKPTPGTTSTLKTQLYDDEGRDVVVSAAMNRWCTVRAVVKLESIFVGNRIALQAKIHEAMFTWHDLAPKRLLTLPSKASAPTSGTESASDVDVDEMPAKRLRISA